MVANLWSKGARHVKPDSRFKDTPLCNLTYRYALLYPPSFLTITEEDGNESVQGVAVFVPICFFLGNQNEA